MNNRRRRWIVAGCLLAPALILSGDADTGYSALSKARYASNEVVNFVRPGLTIKINSADVATDGTINTVFTITDPKGLPLDRNGVTTPGTVSISLVAAFIPKGQEQYTAYTTRAASGAAVASTLQAGADANGTFTTIADGQYRYTFRTKAPSG